MSNFITYITNLLSQYDWIGWAIAIIALFYSNGNNKKNNELLGQPNFMYCQFGDDKQISVKNNAQMRKCGNTNCDKLHWLDIKNIGKFSAELLSVGIFYSDTDAVTDLEHWLHTEHLQSGDTMQVAYSERVSQAAINPEGASILLLEYRSPYSGYKYKRAYTLSISGNEADGKDAPTHSIYCTNEYYKNDSHLCVKRILTRLAVMAKKVAYRLSNKDCDVRLWLEDL